MGKMCWLGKLLPFYNVARRTKDLVVETVEKRGNNRLD